MLYQYCQPIQHLQWTHICFSIFFLLAIGILPIDRANQQTGPNKHPAQFQIIRFSCVRKFISRCSPNANSSVSLPWMLRKNQIEFVDMVLKEKQLLSLLSI